MYSLYDDCVFHSRVSPFGYLGVSAFCELALVFVHLRPSSSSCAKASTLSPLFLDWKYCLLFNFLLSFMSGSYIGINSTLHFNLQISNSNNQPGQIFIPCPRAYALRQFRAYWARGLYEPAGLVGGPE